MSKDKTIGLWRIEESAEDFFCACPFLAPQRAELEERYRSAGRLREVLAVRALLGAMGVEERLSYDGYGRPCLSGGRYVSVSHTKGYAAVLLSPCEPVGIDIEVRSERVHRIADRFMRPDERAATTIELLLHWCTKETLYKLCPEDSLAFDDMRLLPLEGLAPMGVVTAENIKRRQLVTVAYEIAPNYVLTYTT